MIGPLSNETNRFNPRPLASAGGRTFGIRYPSPFFDVAQQFLPSNIHELHFWCRYYFLTNPVINAACTKLAEYPVTRLIYNTNDQNLLDLYNDLESQLRLREFEVASGLEYFVYGSSLVSVYLPTKKWLVCKGCQTRFRAEKNRSAYKWKNMRFFLKCPKCNTQDYALENDVPYRSIRDINLIRWNPENIEIKHNEITGKDRIYYKLPRAILNDIKLGDLSVIETLPMSFLDAARKGKALLLNEDNVYHMKRPTLAQKDQGWGTPLIYPLLKDAFNLQIMKKAQEALLLEHVVPLRVIFPGPGTGGNDAPYGAYNLANWKGVIDRELNMWKRDNNYIPILPVNVGFQQWGGSAKALILHQEFRLIAEQMLAGAGVPVEFVFGGLQWSGSNTSLKALENMFAGYNRQRQDMIFNFILRKIANFMQWPKITGRFDKFKMADDLQRSMFFLQLNQAQKISDQRLLEEVGEDFLQETKRMEEELSNQLNVQRKMQLSSADVQGAAQLRTSRYQAKAQQLMMEAQMESGMPQQPGQEGQQQGTPGAEGGDAAQDAAQQAGMPEGATVYEENAGTPNKTALPTAMASMQSQIVPGAGGVDMRYLAQRAASYLRMVGKEHGEAVMQQELKRIETASPLLHKEVLQLLQQTQGAQRNPLDAGQSSGGGQTDPGRTVVS